MEQGGGGSGGDGDGDGDGGAADAFGWAVETEVRRGGGLRDVRS